MRNENSLNDENDDVVVHDGIHITMTMLSSKMTRRKKNEHTQNGI